MINIVYDNIAFSLQTAGGVTGVWKELISRIIKREDFKCSFLEYKNANKNLNRKDIEILDNSIKRSDNKFLQIERFLNPKLSINSNFIFHSSYYRTCKNKNAKNITTVHDFIYEYYRKGLPRFIHYKQKKDALFLSDAIICVSQNTKQDLLKFFPSLKEKPIFVVYNGVSDVFKRIDLEEKPNYIQRFGKYVLYVGNRNQKHKNFISVLYALEHHPEINLVLVGGGSLTASEIKLWDKIIRNRYYHLSSVDNSKLNVLYNYAFSLIYPSYYEGFGMPIIEAQRAGCPVIATNGSSITEVTENSAILTSKGTSEEISMAINQLKQNKIREDFILKGQVNSSRFSWDKMASEVLQIYKSTI